MTERPKRLVGLNYPPGVGVWSPDVLGVLLGEFDDGCWYLCESHISSSTEFAKHDIGWHARRDFEDIPYEWVGQMTIPMAVDRYVPPWLTEAGMP